MEDNKIIQRICEELERKGKKQIDLTNYLHISQNAMTDWKSGRIKSYMKYLPQIAEFLELPIETLTGQKKHATGVRIPVVGNVAAGIPILAIENIDDDDPDSWEEITERVAATGEFFALRIQGDSMYPKIMDGDIVIVRRQEYFDNGDIVIVQINGDEATCKKIKKAPEGTTLIPLNPEYDPMFFTPKQVKELPVTVIGKVVEQRRKF